MSIEVAKILTDPTTSQKVFNKVLKMNDMQVVKKFSPVISEYKIQLAPNVRRTIRLTEDEFVSKEERFRYGKWQDSVEMHVSGTMEQLENDFILSIKNLMEIISHHPKKYRHIR